MKLARPGSGKPPIAQRPGSTHPSTFGTHLELPFTYVYLSQHFRTSYCRTASHNGLSLIAACFSIYYRPLYSIRPRLDTSTTRPHQHNHHHWNGRPDHQLWADFCRSRGWLLNIPLVLVPVNLNWAIISRKCRTSNQPGACRAGRINVPSTGSEDHNVGSAEEWRECSGYH